MMKTGLIGLAGLALTLTMAGQASAQAGAGVGRSANVPVLAMQNGRVVASTTTNSRGDFSLALAAGTYELCVGGLGGREPVPGNGGRAGGQNRAGSALAPTCTPMTIPSAPTTRSTTTENADIGPVAAAWPRWLRWRYSRPRIEFASGGGTSDGLIVNGTISGGR